MKRLFRALSVIPLLVAALLSGGASPAVQVIEVGAPKGLPADAGAAGAVKAGALPAAGAAQVKDYAKGFEQLIKLGLPDAAKCEYVTLSAYSRNHYNSEGRMYDIRLSGNSWMIEETPKVKGRFIQNGLRSVEVYDSATLLKERQKRMEEALKTNGNVNAVFHDEEAAEVLAGNWKKVDAGKDVERILSFLRKTDGKSIRHDNWSYSGTYGSVFIYTAHFYRKGFTNEANEIVTLLFRRAGDPKKVVSQAVDLIADAQYGSLYETFRKDHDWQAYATGVDAMIVKYGSSWRKTQGVKRLAADLKKRLAMEKAPEITGEGLTAGDSALAAELVSARAGGLRQSEYSGYGGLWLLTDPVTNGAALLPGRSTNGTVFAKIRKGGLKSIPLLIAMLDDEYLTCLDRSDVDGGSYERNYSSFDGRFTPEEMGKMIYKTMNRPLSRGEIARALLHPLQLSESAEGRRIFDSSGDVQQDDQAQKYREWYEQNKSKTALELARLYVEKGDSYQQMSAQAFLMKNGTDADLEFVEQKYLESTDPEVWYQIRQYVEQRGEKAKGFIEKLEAKYSKPETDKGGNELFDEKAENSNRMKAEFESLKKLISTAALESVLEDVLSGKSVLERRGSELQRAIQKEKPDKALKLLLDAVLKVREAQAASQLIAFAQGAGMRMRASGRYGDNAVPAEAGKEPEGQRPAAHSGQWEKLLADNRKIETAIPGIYVTVGDSAADAIIAIYGKSGEIRNYYGMPRNPSPGRRLLTQNMTYARALLAGNPDARKVETPAWKDVTAGIQKAAADKIMAAADAGLQKTVEELGNEELLGLLKKSMKDKALNAKLAPLAGRIEYVDVDESVAPEAKELAAIRGQKLGRPVVEKALELCRKLVASDKVVTCTFTRLGMLDGVAVKIAEIRKDDVRFMNLVKAGILRQSGVPEIRCTVSAGGTTAGATWLPGSVPAPAKEAAAASPLEKLADDKAAELQAEIVKGVVEEQDAFWKAVEKLAAGEENVMRSAAIGMLGKPVLKELPVEKASTNKTGGAVIDGADGDGDFDPEVMEYRDPGRDLIID